MKINLIEYFVETVARYADKVAVIDGDRSVTFGDLDKNARGLAQIIIDSCSCKNKPIALFLPKGIESVYSDLAITYSGNIYMNLDIKNPAGRLQNILSLIRPAAVITNDSQIGNIDGADPDEIRIINIDEHPSDANVPDTHALMARIADLIDTDPYCIINTSGSTGTPKGVVLNHRSFFDFISRSQERFAFTNDEVIGSLSPLVFDIYSYELCLLMTRASTIVVIPDHLSAFPAAILKIMKDHKVSFIFWVP